MKINLERLEELKLELHGNVGPDYANHEPLGLQIIMEGLRNYLHNHHTNETTNMLISYGVLVNETEEENPIVKPHRFTTNG
jgi:hypothetical protein